MGFWGTYIVARADQPLPELPALRQSAESVIWHGRGPGGWQAVQVHRGPEGWSSAALPAPWEATLTALMEQAGHPVLATVIMDSDGAQLIGYSPVAPCSATTSEQNCCGRRASSHQSRSARRLGHYRRCWLPAGRAEGTIPGIGRADRAPAQTGNHLVRHERPCRTTGIGGSAR
jgi:hypothetical protein